MAKRVFKSKKKLSGGNNLFRAWDSWEEGDVLIGKYVGLGREDKYGNDTFQFEVEDAQFSDKKKAKEIMGKVLTLNSTGGFTKTMENVEEGDMLQITYNGQAEIKKGKWKGELAHAIEVDLVEEEGEEEEEDLEDEEDESYADDEDDEDLDDL